MPFGRKNTEGQKRKDRGSDSEGMRKRSSLASMPWTPSQQAILGRYLALEGADFWFPLTLDENWIKDHLHLPMLHMVMDADLSRFKTIVLERPGQLWASNKTKWSGFCQHVGFSWRADCQSHLVVQGADSKGNKITWINFHPTPSSCPLNVLSDVPELEEMVAAAVDDLVDVLDSDEVMDQVKHAVREMEKVPTPAAPDATSSGIAAPTGAECVVPGQIALAEWDFLFKAADAEAKSVRDDAEKNSLHWLEMGSNRRAGDSDDSVIQPVPVSRKGQEQIDSLSTPKSCALKPKS